jgi:hypothetical protein
MEANAGATEHAVGAYIRMTRDRLTNLCLTRGTTEWEKLPLGVPTSDVAFNAIQGVLDVGNLFRWRVRDELET